MKNYLRKHLKKIFQSILKKKKVFLVIIILFFILINYLQFFRNLVIILFLIGIASSSKLYHRLFKNYLGIDLVLFSCIISTYFFGIVIGLIAGIVSLFIADYLGNRLSYTTIVSLIGIVIISFTIPFFTQLPILYAGIIGTIVFEIIVVPLYLLLGSTIPKILTFLISHFLFNLIIFVNISRWV